MSTKSVTTILLILGLLVVGTACPRPEEPPAAPPPPPPSRAEEPEEPVGDGLAEAAIANDLWGVAQIDLRAGPNGCELQRKSDKSRAWNASPHIWIVRNRCTQDAVVEVAEFYPNDPFEAGDPRVVTVPARRLEPIILRVKGPNAAVPGKYTYVVKVNGQTYDPEIDIRDPYG